MNTIIQTKRNKLISIFSIGLILILINSCTKEKLDFDKLNNLTLYPDLSAPLVNIDMTIKNLIKEDSMVRYDSNGLIRFTYRKDNIAEVIADSLIKIPDIAPTISEAKIGEQSIDAFSITNKSTLGSLADNFNPATKAVLQSVSGTNNIFPAMNDQNNTITSMSTPGNYQSIDISKGYLTMTFKNFLPVTIDIVAINLYSMDPFAQLLGQLTFRNISPNNSKSDSLDLSGVTLSSSLAYSIPQFRSFASQSPVLINMNDSIVIQAGSSGLKAVSGTIVYPDMNINAQNLKMDIDAGDSTIQLKHISFSAGKIKYNLVSDIPELINLKINFKGATQNGTAFKFPDINLLNNTVKGEVDITNLQFDLSQDNSQPFNRLMVDVIPKLISSKQLKSFDSSNHVKATFTFEGVSFQKIDGFLGKRTINVDPGDIKFDAFDQIGSGITFTEPAIKIKTSNSLGVPVTVSLNMTGTNKSGQSQTFNPNPFVIDYPSTPGQVANGTKVFDNTQSDLVKLLALAPNKITYSASASVNNNGNSGAYSDFIVKGSKVNVGVEMDIPLSLKCTDLKLSQTISSPLKSMTADQYKLMDEIDLLFKVNNGFPFEGKLDIYFKDSTGQMVDSVLSVGPLFASAHVDNNGKVDQSVITNYSIKATQSLLQNLMNHHHDSLMVKTSIMTYANGSQPVKVYSDYKMQIGIGIRTRLKVSTKK